MLKKHWSINWTPFLLHLVAQLIEQLDVIKTDQAFSCYAMSNKVEIIEKKRSNCSIKSKKIKY